MAIDNIDQQRHLPDIYEQYKLCKNEQNLFLDAFLANTGEWINPKLENPIKFASIGCGYAFEAPTIVQRLEQATYTGIDIQDLSHVQESYEKAGISRVQFITKDARQKEAYQGAKYDVILVRSPNMLQDFAVWRDIFPQIIKHLAPGGFVYMTFFSADPTRLSIDYELMKKMLHNPENQALLKEHNLNMIPIVNALTGVKKLYPDRRKNLDEPQAILIAPP